MCQSKFAVAKPDGESKTEAERLEWDTLCAWKDQRFDYGEQRMVGFALWGERLYCVVYTDRGETRRIISLRKANNREKTAYANQD
ncbi:BrnT family toxin [Endozoicomonas sp. ALC020]|uniref:BrnT family toxin n=1 Tax=unclassified Endozoicomonas TaxID=2644528 RepID=UPI003BAF3977